MPARPDAAGRRPRAGAGARAGPDPAHAGDERLTTRLVLAAVAAAVAAGGGCGSREAPRGRSGPVADGAAAEAGSAPVVRIPDETRQLVTAIVPDWDRPVARLRRWERDAGDQPWRPVGDEWPAAIGSAGAAWGRGLHGDGAPGRPGPIKREGDGRSPAGLFAIGPAFGYAAAAPAGTRVAYTTVDERWRCVDDPRSAHYNRVLDERTVAPDWRSAEDMRRSDELYAWVIEIEHNRAASPGGGSCIFFHVWRGADHPTAGCTAMAEADLVRLLAGLDPAARPVFALLPADDYEAVAAAWGLPRVRVRPRRRPASARSTSRRRRRRR
ncbi:MAG TPA: hypothetical protein VM734_24695 [Kofleriaceae bacterium]|nr:hypothetical protein [Kofleriaceae bacterium]